MIENIKLHLWGFIGIFFEAIENIVYLRGTQYDICNKPIPNFIGFINSIIGKNVFVKKNIENQYLKIYTDIEKINHNKFNEDIGFIGLIEYIKSIGLHYSIKGSDLLTHSHGQLSIDEIYCIRYGDVKLINTIDIVVYPEDTDQIEKIYNFSNKNNQIKLIPYGGGTNVTGCLGIDKKLEDIIYISVDMRKYNKILKVDIYNNIAIIQSGATGKEIEYDLEKQGMTMGHEPDSYEFSTLGGWISTYASGMRRSKYGNIEDIVIDFGYVNNFSKRINEKLTVRVSQGPKLNNLLFGHEGNFGIITDVIVNIKKLPEKKIYESIIFHNMSDGINFLKELYEKNIQPSSIRLVDNEQFKFSQALKPQKTFLEKFVDKLSKFYLFTILGYKIDQLVAATIVYEGTTSFVNYNLAETKIIASKYRGIFGGASNGKAGYNLTHAIAYIRDFLAEYGVLGETFETSINWSNIELMTSNVRKRLIEESKKLNIQSNPFLSYRITQLYNSGVCVYFTFGFYNECENIKNDMELYHILEKAMREEMIKYGGSISHHHGVGKIKVSELKEFYCDNEILLQKNIKNIIDKNNIFNDNNFLST